MSKILQHLRENKHKCPYVEILNIIYSNLSDPYILAQIKYDLRLLTKEEDGYLLVNHAPLYDTNKHASMFVSRFINYEARPGSIPHVTCDLGNIYNYNKILIKSIMPLGYIGIINNMISQWIKNKIYYREDITKLIDHFNIYDVLFKHNSKELISYDIIQPDLKFDPDFKIRDEINERSQHTVCILSTILPKELAGIIIEYDNSCELTDIPQLYVPKFRFMKNGDDIKFVEEGIPGFENYVSLGSHYIDHVIELIGTDNTEVIFAKPIDFINVKV